QGDDGAADGLEQLLGHHAADAVAAVDHHLHGACQLHVVADVVHVGGQDIHCLDAALAAGQVAGVDTGLQGGDLLVGQGVAGRHDLEAVVVRRVVAAGDHHAGAAGQGVGGEV